jgi:hypothetical protein
MRKHAGAPIFFPVSADTVTHQGVSWPDWHKQQQSDAQRLAELLGTNPMSCDAVLEVACQDQPHLVSFTCREEKNVGEASYSRAVGNWTRSTAVSKAKKILRVCVLQERREYI